MRDPFISIGAAEKMFDNEVACRMLEKIWRDGRK